MARTLDTPIQRDPITKKILTGFHAVVGVTNGSTDPNKTFFQYQITTFDSAGREINIKTQRINLIDIPSAVRQDLRAIRNKALADAENKGLLEPGTDTEDF